MPYLRSALLTLTAALAAAPSLSAGFPSRIWRPVTIENKTSATYHVKAWWYGARSGADTRIWPKGTPQEKMKEPEGGWTITPGTHKFDFNAFYVDKSDVGLYGFRIIDPAGNYVEYAMVNNSNASDCRWFLWEDMKNVSDYEFDTVTYSRERNTSTHSDHVFSIKRRSFLKKER